MTDRLIWPALRVDDWTDTRETLHMWLQIIGKLQISSAPLVNHWWNVTFEVSARGLRTRLLYQGQASFDAEFDFVDHVLVIRASAGGSQSIRLEPKTVAAFYAEVQQALHALSLDCAIVARPNEVDPSIPFAEDTVHHSYDAEAAERFWGQLRSAARPFEVWRAAFAGKASPVQLFWGSMDLSVTRYSGRPAPEHTGGVPACPPWVMQEAEFRENIAIGFWPGGSDEGSFYAYQYPEPDGYRTGTVPHGTFDDSLGEWLLPYETVRTSADPDRTVLEFLDGVYDLGADLAEWDRPIFDVNPRRLDAELFGRGKHSPFEG